MSSVWGDNLRLRLHEFLMDLAEMLGKSKGGGIVESDRRL